MFGTDARRRKEGGRYSGGRVFEREGIRGKEIRQGWVGTIVGEILRWKSELAPVFEGRRDVEKKPVLTLIILTYGTRTVLKN
jgi:hypothetical protein